MAITRTTTPVRKKTVAKKTAPTNDVLRLAQVPDMRFYKGYIPRKFPGGVSDFEVFDTARLTNKNLLLEGPTGCGKTTSVLAYCAKRRLKMYAIPSNVGVEPSQLFGKYVPDESGGFVWQDGPVTDIIRNGGWLLLNELNFMLDRVATVLFGMLDLRREISLLDHKGEVIRAHRGKGQCWCKERDCTSKIVVVSGDMNPDYEGTRPLNKALRNRFNVQLWWDYDPAVEKKLLTSSSLVDMATQMRVAGVNGELETPVSTNMLMEFESIVDDLGWDFAVLNFVNHFATDEKAAVEQTIKTHSVSIMNDINSAREGDDDEPVAATNDDDEWGVHGVDWVYEDETTTA